MRSSRIFVDNLESTRPCLRQKGRGGKREERRGKKRKRGVCVHKTPLALLALCQSKAKWLENSGSRAEVCEQCAMLSGSQCVWRGCQEGIPSCVFLLRVSTCQDCSNCSLQSPQGLWRHRCRTCLATV